MYLGRRLSAGQDNAYEALGVTVTRERRPTKEYPRGQEVYALVFDSGEERRVAEQDSSE